MNPKPSPEVIATVAAEWEQPVEQMTRLAQCIEERGGTMTGDFREDLTLTACAYSKACQYHECVAWLPFDLMPGWDDDVFCILEDEEAWLKAIDANESIFDLAKKMKAAR